MQSTFHGLETARRGMMTQQYALHTVGHNISNANTPGYTRQRVNFTQTEPYPGAGMNKPRIPGHLGTGVKAGSIQRVRDQFLDIQYRNETNKVGYWNARYSAFEKMEDILNEPSEQGLSKQIDLFWSSLQDLSVDPEDSGARSVVRERGRFVAETFNYLHSSLSEIRHDYKNEIDVTQKEVNAILKSLDNVNAQIRQAEPHGYVTNDLYDDQDRLLDQLSRIVNIEVVREESSGQPNDAAEGAVTVYLVDEQGNRYVEKDEDGNDKPVKLIDGTGQEKHMKMDIQFDDSKSFVTAFSFTNHDGTIRASTELDKMPRGEMKALIMAFGYGEDASSVRGLYPDMIAQLNTMATEFATEMNNIHQLGFTLPGENGEVTNGGLFFDLSDPNGVGAAKAIKVHDHILSSRDHIAAAGVNTGALTVDARAEYDTLMAGSPKNYSALHTLLKNSASFTNGQAKAFAGDGSNAKLLANMKDTLLNFNGDTATVTSFYQSVIGDMAVETQEAVRMLSNSSALQDSVDFRRQSVSNVSLDEEMTMMIQYQHAYNAAARNITMIDEMLDKIINGMGVVGR
ncbi:flagellar hook-associated protein FlgK [bacterium LRH843]|nr:flagellar hook-associated protein FlgK [bacterium LRH843]